MFRKSAMIGLALMGLAATPFLANNTFAGEVMTWNLSRDTQIGIKKNPNGVWSYMQNNTGLRDPAQYTLLPNFWGPINAWGDPMNAWNNDSEQGYVGIPVRNFTWDSLGQPIQAKKGITHMHPGPSNQSIIRWRSPIGGTIHILGRISDVDPVCGNGIRWSLDKGKNVLQSGDLVSNGVLINVQNIPVLRGTSIYLVVDAKGEYTCDTTNVDLLIAGESQ